MKILTVTLLLPIVLGLTIQEDDIVFEDEDASSFVPVVHQRERETPRSTIGTTKKFYENIVPNLIVNVGHVLAQTIPDNAFPGDVERYEIRMKNDKTKTNWIYFDHRVSTFLGVPTKTDVGQTLVNVTAYGTKKKDNFIVDFAFVITVKPEKSSEINHKDGKRHCDKGDEQTLLGIIVDAKFDNLKPAEKVRAVTNLARYLGLNSSTFSMHPTSVKEDASSQDSIRETHPGNLKHGSGGPSTIIQWQVGCGGQLWNDRRELRKKIKYEAQDGTLAEVLQIGVLKWQIKTDGDSLRRNRRETGSGNFGDPEDYDEDDYSTYGGGYDDLEDDEDDESITELPSRTFNGSPKKVPEVVPEKPEHPHRHHHGEETIGIKPYDGVEVDEDEIRPSANGDRELESKVFASGPVIVPTTYPQSSTSISSTSLQSSTSTTTTTTTTTPSPSTTNEEPMPTTTNQSIDSIATSLTTAISSSSTTPGSTATTTTTTHRPLEIPSTVDNEKSDDIDDYAERTNLIESETQFTTIFQTENIATTLAPSFPSTTPQINAIPALTSPTPSDKTDSNSTSAVVFSVAEEKNTKATELPPTTIQDTPTTTTSSMTLEITTSTTQMPIVVTTTTTTPALTTMPTTTTTTTTTTTPIPETTPLATTTTTPQPTTTTSSTAAPTTTTTTTTTESPKTISPIVTTEKIEYGVRNFPPRKNKHLKKMTATAGKLVSHVVPAETFSDVEDGDTRKLKLSLYVQGSPAKSTYWLQLNSATQEIYGLPLDSDVSKWDHNLVVTDSEGLNVTERIDIWVQQHKSNRAVNHEFNIYLKIDKRSAFPTDVDWEIKVVRSLARLYGDDNTSQITVRSIDITQDQAIFTWTNDSVPLNSSECPKDEIDKLLNVLTDENNEPSSSLMNALAPEIRVKRVVYRGIGQCEGTVRPETPKVSTEGPNKRPIPRNQIDHINATVGQLVVYRVPDDAFYDPEDGPTSKLKITLLAKDRTPILADNWLQFDTKNQEFYGVPMHEDSGRKEYQLVATDKEGLSATDGMIVTVEPAPTTRNNLEILMKLGIPYEPFARSATMKKNFIEKIRDIFQDRDTSAIMLESIRDGTFITWRNTTLPTDYCPNDEIEKLNKVIGNPDKSVRTKIQKIMGDEFLIDEVTLNPTGMCLGQKTGVHKPDSVPPASGDSAPLGPTNDEYLVVFVLPATIIAAMILLAGLIACVLYRRRRSGKMSVSEQDDERQSFRSKGIPVIFQDELDEKPDPGNKSPVILKEEKPPLPPPEYQKAEDGADEPMLPNENSGEPYQPPPPFTTSRENSRQNRPKPTPTYRKPPPYVPP